MKHKILIVDDEPANVRALERLFRDEHDVLTATSGAEALELLEHHDVALLISDQRMPEMSGMELVERTVPLRPHMVRVLLTGYTDVSSLIDAINCGYVYKYVTKPWNDEDLAITISRALAHYQEMKSHHNLKMVNDRLRVRLNEIAELATTNDELDPKPRLAPVVRQRQLDVRPPN
jgi:two-component system, sensor histidine kinase and response regulator